MTDPYGAWATTIDAARIPQLSAFWKKRRTVLAPAGQISPVLRRLNLLGLVAAALLIGVLPTFHATHAVAGQEKVLQGQSSDQKTNATSKESAAKSKETSGKTKSQPQATARRTIRIRVVGPDDKPMPGANVHSSIWTKEPFQHNHDYVCDGQGEAIVELPRTLDILRIWTSVEGYVPLFVHWEKDWQAQGHPIPQQFTVKLTKGTVIGGFVKNEDGQPIQSAKVEVSVHSGNRGPPQNQPSVSTWLAVEDDARITDARGRWTLDNVPAGDDVEVTLKLSHPDYISDFRWGVLQRLEKITTASLRQQTTTLVMARGVRVTGAVTDPQGKPVVGAVVVWGDEPYQQNASGEVRSDAKGVYRFPPLPPATVTVTAVAEGWAPQLRKVAITPENPAADFKLQPGKTLRLRFRDESGKPVPEVGVGIDGWRDSKSLYNNKHPNLLDTRIPEKADKNGVYQWTWAPDDQVRYNFGKEGYNYTSEPFIADGVEHEVKLSRGTE